MRNSSIKGHFAALAALSLLQLGACGGNTAVTPGQTGAAGATPGSAGQSGNAGANGTAGAQGGFAGDASGAAGATLGAAGQSGGAAGGGAGAAQTADAGGTAGASTDGGASVAGIGGVHPSGSSMGCMKSVSDAPQKWVEHDVMVNVAAAYQPQYETRKFFTMVPKTYDPTRSYPVTFWGPGCGATGAEGNQLMGSGQTENYIQVMLLQKTSCFSTSSADSPEVPYFDVALQGVEDGYCVDKSKVFVAGYSSGSWLTHLLACQRGNVIRGMGSASGGILEDHGTCTGAIAGIMTGDSSDTTNPIVSVDKTTGFDKGSGAARDMILKANGCQMTSKPWDAAFPGCVVYDGCPAQYPVVWCLTMGQGHSDGGMISAQGFWKFWSALPSW
ncbi:MAG TPA: hypothetical protein VH560_09475 [Polyangia bacterium]|nr:hypothetical protein [Polyangia bacterium]